jgi:outer membrane protein OmpA-like peptidoglycan-associated protein
MDRAFRIAICTAGLAMIVGGCGAHRGPVESVAKVARAGRAPDEAPRTREHHLARLRRELTAVQSRTSDRGVVLTIPDALFEVGKADLKASAERDLVSITAFLNAHPDQKVSIEAHGSPSSAEAHDHELALRRVTVVETFFLRKGIDPARLEIAGLSENQPIASNAPAAGHHRVEIVML